MTIEEQARELAERLKWFSTTGPTENDIWEIVHAMERAIRDALEEHKARRFLERQQSEEADRA